MFSENELLDSIYEKDPQTGAYIIKIKVRNYSALFNNLDPYPLNRRDIDDDIQDYIEDCASDIPARNIVSLHIVFSDEKENPDMENRVRSGFKGYFNYLILLMQRDIRATWKRSLLYMVASLFFISLYFYLDPMPASQGILLGTLKEGVSIGGWVFLWEAFVQVSFKNSENRKGKRKYERLKSAEISFIYP